jgi:4-amino-4-deoxy-L-arabinose transferase-like glycosyltransferase
MRRLLPLVAALVLLLLAVALRAPSLTAGRPYMSYVDEGNYLHPVARMLRVESWDPGWYMYPQLPVTAAAVAARLYAPFHPDRHDGRTFQQDLSVGRAVYDLLEPFELLLAGRVLSFLAGLGVVALTGLFAWRLTGRSLAAGLFAAFLAAVLPPLVIRGGIATVDPWATLFVLASFYSAECLRTSECPKRDTILGGLMAGFAFASKYPAVLAAVGVGMVLLFSDRTWREKIRLAVIGGIATGVGMVVAMPALVYNLRGVWLALRDQNELYENLPTTPTLWAQTVHRAEWDLPYEHPELGYVYLFLVAAGTIVALRDRRTAKAVAGWFVFFLICLILYLPKSFQAFRNLLPLMPLSVLLVTLFYMKVREWLGKRVWACTLVDVGAILLVLALFARPVTGYVLERHRLVDSRTEAVDWLAARVRPEQRVLVLHELAFVQSELRRLPAAIVPRRLPQTAEAARRRRADYLLVGHLESAKGPIDMALLPPIQRNYRLVAQFGEHTTPPATGWWTGNRQVVYVFERKPWRKRRAP